MNDKCSAIIKLHQSSSLQKQTNHQCLVCGSETTDSYGYAMVKRSLALLTLTLKQTDRECVGG